MDNLKDIRRKDPLVGIFLAVAVVLGALSLYQWAAVAAQGTTAPVPLPKQAQPADAQAQITADKSVAANLKKKNLFLPPEPPRNPVTEVAGILGSEALINGRWYKAGAKVGEGKNAALIVAIEPTKVRVRWDGKETEFLPINASGASSATTASAGGPPGRGEMRRGGPGVARPEGMPVRSGGVRRGGPPPEEMAAYVERMKNATSNEERRKINEEMHQRYSGQSP
jgi:hypothetical protein